METAQYKSAIYYYYYIISNYISFPPQIAFKLIEAGGSRDILQIQGLSIDELNNTENTTIKYIE